jgi:hypothetical protein
MPNGYGKTWFRGSKRLAHRVMWELTFGEEPAGVLLHSCDNPRCVNVEHLSIGTQKDNALDAKSKGRLRYQKMTVCNNGHPRVNLARRVRSNGMVEYICRACEKARTYRHRKGKREKEE